MSNLYAAQKTKAHVCRVIFLQSTHAMRSCFLTLHSMACIFYFLVASIMKFKLKRLYPAIDM